MPYYEEVDIEFPVDPHSNTLIFFGENTKGKTSILNALRWVLYGEFDSREMRYVDIVNRAAYNRSRESGDKAEVKVVLNFEVNEQKCELIRTMDGSDEDDQHGKVIYKRENRSLTAEEGKDFLEQIAPESTSRFFLFDGELLREYEELLDENSRSANKIKKAIEAVMGFPTLKQSIEITEEIENELKQESSKIQHKNAALRKLKEERDKLEDDIALKKEERDNLDKQIDRDSADLDKLKQKISHDQELKKQLEDLENLKKQRDAHNQSITNYRDQMSQMKGEVWKSILQEHYGGKLSTVEDDSEENSKEMIEKAIYDYKIRCLEEIKDKGVCPVCEDETVFGDNLSMKLNKLRNERSELNEKLSAYDLNTNKAWRKFNQHFKGVTNLAHYLRVENQWNTTKFTKRKIERKINDIIEMSSNEDENLNELQKDGRKATRLELAIEKAQEDKNQVIEELQRLNQEKQERTKDIQDNSVGNEKKIEKSFFISQQLNSIFDNAEEFLRKDVASEVEKVANDAFKAMISRPDDYDELKITDTYGLHIKAQDGSIVPLRSKGAEQVVALALIDGLNKVGKSPGPVVMDTPFGRLDNTHRKNVIKYMSESARQLVMFVHSGELEEESAILESIKDKIGRTYNIRSDGAFKSFLEERRGSLE